MFIDVSEIRKSPGQTVIIEVKEVIKPLKLGGDEIRIDHPVNISLEIKNTGRLLVISGQISGSMELVCSRCLERYPYPLGASFEEKFCHASDVSSAGEEGIDTEDIHVYEGNRIDIEAVINENIVMSVPMKSVCEQSCKGLCTDCGTNLNNNDCSCESEDVDPRLAALKKYFEV